jgi:hypothetical protein
MSVVSTGATFLTSAAATNINTAAALSITAGGNASIGAANTTISGGSINLNGPAAPTAAKGVAAKKLTTHDNPATSSKEKWEGKNRYQSKTPVKSIMKRIPMHEPWILHENQAPQLLTPTNTDREK